MNCKTVGRDTSRDMTHPSFVPLRSLPVSNGGFSYGPICREILILIGLSAVCYMFTSLANPAVVHRYVPSTSSRTNAKMLAIDI